MTIKEFVLSQKSQGINEWIKVIKDNGFIAHEDIIIKCAEHFNMITINHDADFVKTIK